ncbi:MAG: HU family DNA-binding protein [Pseudomonadota bacterium]
MKITKNILVSKIVEKTDLTQAVINQVLNAYTDTLHSELAHGNQLMLHNIGKFEVKHRNERTGRNPQTGDPIIIPSKNIIGFKASKPLMDIINA